MYLPPALRCFRRLLSWYGHADKLFQKAEKLLQKQEFDAARKIFLRLFEGEPDNKAVLLNLADLSLRLGRPEDSPRYNSLLADLYIERKDVSKAYVAPCLAASDRDAAVAVRAFLTHLSVVGPEGWSLDDVSPDYCAALSDLYLGPGFDAVDAVTEIINRLQTSMETLRKHPEAGILLVRFES